MLRLIEIPISKELSYSRLNQIIIIVVVVVVQPGIDVSVC